MPPAGESTDNLGLGHAVLSKPGAAADNRAGQLGLADSPELESLTEPGASVRVRDSSDETSLPLAAS